MSKGVIAVRNLLFKYRRNEDKLQRLLIKIEVVEDDRTGRSAGMGEIKSKSDKISDPTGDLASEIVDKVAEIQEEIDKIEYEMREVQSILRVLDEQERVVIIARYIYRQPWTVAARAVKLSVDKTQDAALGGLTKIERMIEGVNSSSGVF